MKKDTIALELKVKIELLIKEKDQEISNGNYERAAQIRDEIRKYTEHLKNLSIPKTI